VVTLVGVREHTVCVVPMSVDMSVPVIPDISSLDLDVSVS